MKTKTLSLLQELKRYFLKYGKEKGHYLLALSGGYDSKALCELLLELKELYDFSLSVVHVDHNWREESSKECEILEEYAKNNNLSFFSKKLGSVPTSDRENDARNKRYQFFQEIYSKLKCDGIFFAHHRDDQIETTVKRFLEGASLFALFGMQEISHYQGMVVLRPLLNVSKNDLCAYLEEKKISAFDDKSNYSFEYTRNRIRHELLPIMQKAIGKTVSAPLGVMAFQSLELKQYLDRKIALDWSKRKSGVLGNYIDLQTSRLDPFELKYLVRKMFWAFMAPISKSNVERIVSWIQEDKKGSLILKEVHIYVDRKRLFLLYPTFNNFHFEVKVVSEDVSLEKVDWQTLWKGESVLAVPMGEYQLKTFQKKDRLNQKLIYKCYQERKIPIFLKSYFPVLFRNNVPFFDLLTGIKDEKIKLNNEINLRIKIKK
ncbi:MAG TPA: tRNA lysidine(34) synthetase TilS [Chlamydiales bacterium]|nr:tRNA lysidine(34) synthetase TilS [Chlamydiales bacterium]